MHSSTSSSSAKEALIMPPERELPSLHYGVVAVTAMLLFAISLGGWEMYWRHVGAVPGYRNSEGLWSTQRRRIDNGEGNATVLIGSSRTMSDMQLDVWERLDGHRPIQLALEGTSPATPLEGLADDPNFKGRLIVGVAPGLFFSGYAYRGEVFDYYAHETPSERAGQWLSMHFIEPFFAFDDPDFALLTVLKRQPWPQRKANPASRDVRKLFVLAADRNTHLWQRLEQDPEYQQLCKEIWMERPPVTEELKKQMLEARQKQLDRIVAAVEKLKARGVEVTFILHPVIGDFGAFELGTNPRAETWDVLLSRTGERGIHFQDYPQLQGHRLPEWSHMSTADARKYTEDIYKILQQADQAPPRKVD